MFKDYVCWYNNKDLSSFVENDENKSRNLLRNKKRNITDIKFYSEKKN
jgi:hypothetical protein